MSGMCGGMVRTGVALLLALAATPAAAQDDAGAVATTPARPPARAAWLSDRLPLAVGDLVTVVVEERTAAREKVSRVSTANRAMDAGFDAHINSGSGNPTDMQANLGSDLRRGSRDVGEAQRAGDLTAALTARIVEITPEGLARLRGSKRVTVDGRLTEVTLEGLVRPADVTARNLVHSDRIADVTLVYKGKQIGPKSGLFGKVLGAIWP